MPDPDLREASSRRNHATANADDYIPSNHSPLVYGQRLPYTLDKSNKTKVD
jgi:hypothetical protein